MSTFLIRQPAEVLKLVKHFVDHSELAAIRLKEFSASSAPQDPDIQEGLQLDLNHNATRADVEAGAATFDVNLEIKALGDKDPAKMLFRIDCCYELKYSLAPGYAPTPEELEAFKKGNAVFHCWPFVREFVQSSTQRMGLSVPPIPMLRLRPLPPAQSDASAVPKASKRSSAPRRRPTSHKS